MNFKLTPAEFLRELGWTFSIRGKWLALKVCPFCDGGASRDTFTFIVHAADGNYSCQRSKCGAASGSFWKLIESQDRDPKDYLGARTAGSTFGSRKPKRKYIYGR